MINEIFKILILSQAGFTEWNSEIVLLCLHVIFKAIVDEFSVV